MWKAVLRYSYDVPNEIVNECAVGTGEVQSDTDFVNMLEEHGVVSVRLAIRQERVTVT